MEKAEENETLNGLQKCDVILACLGVNKKWVTMVLMNHGTLNLTLTHGYVQLKVVN